MFRWLINLMIASMIFFPERAFQETPEAYGFDWKDVFLQTEDRVQLHGWFLRAREEKGVILLFHGNAGNISHRLFKAKGWIDRNFSVFLVDYRGFGQSQGSLRCEADVLHDAKAAFNWLIGTQKVPLSKIILYGESIGTYPAVRLGSENEVASIVLESPFTAFKELARIHYGMIPGALADMLLKDFSFPNIDYIQQLKAPVFMMHGDKDEICPYAMGKELFGKAKVEKEFFTIAGGTHNELPVTAGKDFWQRPYAFIIKFMS